MNTADQLKNNIINTTNLKIDLMKKGILTPENIKQCLEKREDIEKVLVGGNPVDIFHVTTTPNYYPIYEDTHERDKLLDQIVTDCNKDIAKMLDLDEQTTSNLLSYYSLSILVSNKTKYLFSLFL